VLRQGVHAQLGMIGIAPGARAGPNGAGCSEGRPVFMLGRQ